MTGTWQTTVPAGLQGYRIRATPEGKVSVLFLNHLRGEAVERTAVLFPGETSFLLDLVGLSASTPTGPLAGSGRRVGRTVGDVPRLLSAGLSARAAARARSHPFCPRPLPARAGVASSALAGHDLHRGAHHHARAGDVWLGAGVPEDRRAGDRLQPRLRGDGKHPAAALLRVAAGRRLRLRSRARARLCRRAARTRTADQSRCSSVSSASMSAWKRASSRWSGIAALATAWLRDPGLYRRAIVIPGSAAIAIMGLWWTVTRVFGE